MRNRSVTVQLAELQRVRVDFTCQLIVERGGVEHRSPTEGQARSNDRLTPGVSGARQQANKRGAGISPLTALLGGAVTPGVRRSIRVQRNL